MYCAFPVFCRRPDVTVTGDDVVIVSLFGELLVYVNFYPYDIPMHSAFCKFSLLSKRTSKRIKF